MTDETARSIRRLRRLEEELAEEGVSLTGDPERSLRVLTELDYALRPAVHERRAPSFGSIVDPLAPRDAWTAATGLTITRNDVDDLALSDVRRFADGLSSWIIRGADDEAGGGVELVVFDRPAGSERDLVVIAAATSATIVQRHPSGVVRTVGPFGVVRWDGVRWHREPPVAGWLDELVDPAPHEWDVLRELLTFAVHDLGSRGIGALLVYRPDDTPGPVLESRLAAPPPLHVLRPTDLAPLRHVLAQVDGAAVFDASGALRHLGVRLVPSTEAESGVEGLRGMRHTSGRRYSYDDPTATVIVVSEDGPVTVLREGEVLGRSGGAT